MANLQDARTKFYKLRCQKAADALKRNGFEAVVAESRVDATDKVLDLISTQDTVGVPGTVTVRELDIMPALEKRGNKVVHHWLPGLTPEEGRRVRLDEMLADVLLTSTNALTIDGKLVNIDGGGNRVASMIFGPKHVIVVAGANKICETLDEALLRAKQVAAPINAIRLNTKTPCVQTGQCMDCKGSTSICAVTIIMDRKPSLTDITVVLVPEDLGY